MRVGVLLGSVLMMLGGVQRMTMRDFGVMRGLFVIAILGVGGRFAVMLGRVFVMFRRLLVMLVNVMRGHMALPEKIIEHAQYLRDR